MGEAALLAAFYSMWEGYGEVNKNLKKNGYRTLRIAIVSSAILLFSIFGILTNMTSIYATNHKAAILSPLDTTTPTTASTNTPTTVPTDTPIPTPIPTAPPTPIPTTLPTPIPTTAPIVTPTPIPVQPTPIFPPAGGIIPVVTPVVGTATPTVTPVPTPGMTATPGATATTVATAGNRQSTNTTPTDTTSTGGNILVPATAVTLGLLAVCGVVGWVFWRRRNNQPLLPAGAAIQTALQTRQNEAEPLFGAQPLFQQMAFAGPVPNSSPLTVSPVAPYAAGPMGFSSTTLQSNVPPIEQGYRPSALRPITTSMPTNIAHPQLVDAATYPPTSDLSPLSLDTLDVSNGETPHEQQAIAPQGALQPFSGIYQLPPATPPSLFVPEPVSPPNENIAAPSIKDDPMLEAIMRQAQMGIYALPDRPAKENGNTASHRKISNNTML